MSGRANKLRRQERQRRKRWALRILRTELPPWTSWWEMIDHLEARLDALDVLGRSCPPPMGWANRIGHGQALARSQAREAAKRERNMIEGTAALLEGVA